MYVRFYTEAEFGESQGSGVEDKGVMEVLS